MHDHVIRLLRGEFSQYEQKIIAYDFRSAVHLAVGQSALEIF